MASGWNLWVRLVGVIVRRYIIDILIIIITFPCSTCISSFFGTSIPTSLFIFKMFFRSCLCYFCAIWQTFLKDHSKSFKNRDHANIINNYIEHTSTAHARERES